MKTIAFFSLMMVIVLTISAQTPQSFKYQSIIRDNNGNPVMNEDVSFKVCIMQGTPVSTPVYCETHSYNTGNFGMVNLEIGKGLVQLGNFNEIHWAEDEFYFQLEYDLAGGNNFQIAGTSQILSVPYAIHSASSQQAALSHAIYALSSEERDNFPNPQPGMIILNTDTDCLNSYTGIKWIETCGDCVPSPSQAIAGDDLMLFGQMINPFSVVLSANSPVSGDGFWTVLSGEGGSFTDAANPGTNFNGIIGNDYILKWTISNICGSNEDQLIIRTFQQIDGCSAIFTDTRDGQSYQTIQIGNQCWMAQNLNIGSIVTGNQFDNGIIEKRCYDDNPSNCNTYGGLYQWNEMMQYTTVFNKQGICPEGWEIPDDMDWIGLEGTVDSQYNIEAGVWLMTGFRGSDAGKVLKSSNDWNNNGNGTNAFGFNALPGGAIINNISINLNIGTLFWSALDNVLFAMSRGLKDTEVGVNRESLNKDFFLSVRCIKACEPQPTSASAGEDQTVPPGSVVNLQANTPTEGTGQWSVMGGAGGYFSDPANPNSQFTMEDCESYLLRWEISNECGSSYDDVYIWVSYPEILADAGPDSMVYVSGSTFSVILAGNIPQPGTTGEWYIDSGNGGSLQNPSLYNSEFYGITGNTYELFWMVTHDLCGIYAEDQVMIGGYLSIPGCGIPFTDTRANQQYNTVQIGNHCWMSANLNIGNMIPGGLNQLDNQIIEKYCYNDEPDSCSVYGGLYQWDELMYYFPNSGSQGICPDGWHVPSENEWLDLANVIGGYFVAGGKLKESGFNHWFQPNEGATNYSGFTALPGGIRITDGSYTAQGESGLFWSSDQMSYDRSFFGSLSHYSAEFMIEHHYKTCGLSVRCLKD
jgi:uncharacterized protein (TIGR02145 family)